MATKNERALAVFDRLAQERPQPETELEYTNHYTLLIAVLLSAQTTDKQVNKCTKKLFALASTAQDMVRLPLDKIESCVSTLGLYRQKAKHLLGTSRLLLERHGGQVPDTRQDLEALPGVGRKTANVVLNVAFHQPTMPVDTHVFRLARRLGLSKGMTPLAVEKDLLSVVPKHHAIHGHHHLILHGRYVCKALRPACEACCLRQMCPRVGLA